MASLHQFGGDASCCELDAYSHRAIAMPPVRHDKVAHAINERTNDTAPPSALLTMMIHRGFDLGAYDAEVSR